MHCITELCCNGHTISLTHHLCTGQHLRHWDWKQRHHHRCWQLPQREETQCKGEEDHIVSVMLTWKLHDPVMGLMWSLFVCFISNRYLRMILLSCCLLSFKLHSSIFVLSVIWDEAYSRRGLLCGWIQRCLLLLTLKVLSSVLPLALLYLWVMDLLSWLPRCWDLPQFMLGKWCIGGWCTLDNNCETRLFFYMQKWDMASFCNYHFDSCSYLCTWCSSWPCCLPGSLVDTHTDTHTYICTWWLIWHKEFSCPCFDFLVVKLIILER